MAHWLSRLLRRTPSSPLPSQGHLTFGSSTVGRSISRTGRLLQKQIWIRPIIAIIILGAIGYGLRIAIERTMKGSLQSQLQTLLNVERSMLETWLRAQASNAESLANARQVRELTAQIFAASQPPELANVPIANVPIANESPAPKTPELTTPVTARVTLAALGARLAQELAPGMSAHSFASFILTDKQQQIVASSNQELVGQNVGEYERFLSRTLEGHVAISPPFGSVVLLKDENGRLRTGVPTMFVSAPIRDADFQVVGALGLRIRPEREFTRILQLGQMGKSGETYAIDKTGLLVSNSRFDESMILLGLLPDLPDVRSILTVSARDPGGNLELGYRPKLRRAELPLTKAALAVTAGSPGVDVEGYRGYRGVPVVGAWHWLPDYGLGVITEIDFAEAYRPLTILRWAFFSIFGLLMLASVAIFVFSMVVTQLQREAQKAVIEAKHLGQYRLEEKLGAGAMGVVYKGHHAMLRRPTAIKMLSVDKVNEASIERFEHEVQITCKLNHPSTVAIYDYGRTPEGVFYYAMEYLDGIDLQQLVTRYGPQPEGRVIHILKQICGSLYEAHSLALVHRDIKPANVMLNRRGGEPDVVKVLDFGLVRALDEAKRTGQASGLSGTPLYMSPESIETPEMVDGRSDLYAVGAIGYFLLTGQTVFQGQSLVDLCNQHLSAIPDSPSLRLGKPISTELESAVLACLEKSRAKRPQTARDLINLLDRSPTAHSWSVDEAEAWWGRHERSLLVGNANPDAESGSIDDPRSSAGQVSRTASSGFDQTMALDQQNPK